MTEVSYEYQPSLSDQALARKIGEFIKHHRLQQNKSQDVLSKEAGISRSTLSLLERGQTVTLSTLLQVLRVLDMLHVLNAFTIEKSISPLAMLREEEQKRLRAGKSRRTKNKEQSDW